MSRAANIAGRGKAALAFGWLFRAGSKFLTLTLALLSLGYPVYAQTATTSTTLAVSANAVTSGTAVTLTATVVSSVAGVPAAPVFPGAVNFCDAVTTLCENSVLVGSAQLTAAGTATLRFVPAIGNHSYYATFTGTRGNSASTSATQAVAVSGVYATAATVTSSGANPDYTLLATIAGIGSLTLAPVGNVSFLDNSNDGALLGMATLGAGVPGQTLAAAPGSPITVGGAPFGVATGDFNDDGFVDFAVENYGSGTVSVLIGNGDGTFKPQVTYGVGGDPERLVAADVNGDGILDLLVANTGSGNIGVLLGNGDGTFQAQVTYTTTFGSASLIVGDYNGDGIPDIAVSNFYSASVSILLGVGDGTFQQQVSYAVGNSPRTLTSADFNGDGFIDLAVANEGDNTLSILFGNGDGTFQAQVTYPTGDSPEGIVAVDVNGDGLPDLVVANSSDATVGILLGNAAGTFPTMTTYAAGSNPVEPVVADFNGDGKPDVAVENFEGGTESLLLGNGDGTFQTQTVFATGTNPYNAAAADFNGDGFPDLVISNFGSNNETVFLDLITSTVTATLANVSFAVAGTHNVVASYPGSTTFSGSVSPAIPLMGPGTGPTIVSLTPNSTIAGVNDLLVTINGTGFVTGATATVNGVSQAATFLSAVALTTTIPAADLATAGTLTLTVVNPDGGTSNGAAFTVTAQPVQVTPAMMDFGDVTVGTTSAAQTVTVTNTLTTALTITQIALQLGSDPADFIQTNNCPATLAAGGSCQVNITFTPGAVGTRTAGLGVYDNSPPQPQIVQVSGNGTGGILQVSPGDLKTIAGVGTAGYSGDGGAAIAAELNSPDGIAFDTLGDLYIADLLNNVVRKVDTTGNITTVAGNGTKGFGGDGGPAISAELHGPNSVAVDAAGNLYIEDTGNNRVRKVDTTGVISTFAGTGVAGFAGDGGPATAAELNENQGARFDAEGNLYVPQCIDSAVRKIDTQGNITTVAGTGVDGFSGDGGLATAAQLFCPSGVAIDAAGNLYIADFGNDLIRKVSAAGIITTVAGTGVGGYSGDGGPATSAAINLPNDVSVDEAGNVYIADDGNNRVRKIDTTGVITTVVGGLNNAGSAGVNSPLGVTLDGAGNLYFSDAGNNAVREVFPAGALAFPATPIGTVAAPLTVTLSNIGNLPVTIASQASFTLGGNTTDFSLVGGSCLQGATLAAGGGVCTLQIGFTPTVTGARSLTVSVADDAVFSPQSFQIGGTGLPAAGGAVVLTLISPAGAAAGAADTTIAATGANFTATSVVNFGTTPLVTTFVSATQLTAVIPAAELTAIGNVAVTVTDASSASVSAPQTFTIVPALAVTFTGPATSEPGEQPALSFALQQAYPAALSGTMTLTFAPAVGSPDNPQVQFATGGRTFTFTLPANSTATPPILVQAGTTSGTISVTLVLTANGINVTPPSVAPIVILIPKLAPTISSLSFTTSGDTLTVVVSGYSSTRDILLANFSFTAAHGASLADNTISVATNTIFATWFTAPDSAQYGSAFTYTQQFTLSGPATAIAGVGVTLRNSIGTSAEATSP